MIYDFQILPVGLIVFFMSNIVPQNSGFPCQAGLVCVNPEHLLLSNIFFEADF